MGSPGPASRRSFGPDPDRSRAGCLAGFTLLLLVLAAAGLSDATPARASSATLDEPAQHPIWRALLHQLRTRPDRKTRAALHDANFLLHPEGARRPDLELAATIDAMRDAPAEEAQALRCRFPARHRFLVERGLLDVPRGRCPELDDWRAQIGEARLTLVFPEAFLGNPSSMFGHTLLRFDPVSEEGGTRGETLLGWTLDYTADPGDDPGPVYLIRGLVGGYRGHFGISPYYEKTRLYSDWQDRDIWEYPLSMPPDAIELVLLHVWEMEGVGLPYIFFTRNCSEYLLEILSVGWPELGRGGGFPPTHTPVDTLRAMQAIAPDAVGEPALRASPATRLQEALGAMEREQANLVEALAAGRTGPDDPALDALPPHARGRVLVLAYDLLRHMVLARRIPSEIGRERSSRLLRARSRLRVPASPEPPITRLERVPPDRGHRTARVVAGGGVQDRDGFVELRALPAFHTALDAPGGFAEGGEIRFLETAVRYYPELDRVRLHELVALDVTTASPWRRPFRPLAWHTQLGLRTRMVSKSRGRGLETASIFRGRGGLGAAIAPRPRLHLYAFGELAVEAGPGLEGNGAAGPLARVGASWSSAAGRFTLRAEGLAGGLFGEDAWASLRGELEGRVSLGRNWSVSASGAFDRAYDVGHFEGRVGLIRYF